MREKRYLMGRDIAKDLVAESEKIRKRCDIRFLAEKNGLTFDEAKGIYIAMDEDERKQLGDERLEAERRQEEEAEKQKEEDALREKFDSLLARIPERFKDAELEDFKGLEIYERAVEAASSDRSWIALGSNGVGKTRLAYALQKTWIRRSEDCRYLTATELSSLIRMWIMQGCDVCSRLETEYGYVRHLIIDEIDKVKVNENFIAFFSHIIDFRYSHLKQTIVLGNIDMERQSPQDLTGESAYSRLTGEDAITATLWYDDDRRKRKA